MESGPVPGLSAPQQDFIAELRRWRDVAGFSQKALAKKIGYDSSYVSKVECGTIIASKEFAENADRALQAGHNLVQQWKAMAEVATAGGTHRERRALPPERTSEPASTLIVEQELANLLYTNEAFITTIRRQLRNIGTEPVNRYMIRIAVDRFPGDPDRSNRLYREDPLTWEEIALAARCEGEPMSWTTQHDRDAFKEVWLLFENQDSRFPLYPDHTTWIEYEYHVAARKWGPWWQRAVRLPTRRIQMRLDLPANLEPSVWGMETSMSAGASTFRNAIQRESVNDRLIYTWSTTDPPLHARYRIEWKFRNQPLEKPVTPTAKPSEQMAAVGITQEGDQILHEPTLPLDLPAEAEDARRIVAELAGALSRVIQVHSFSKGVGIAAPQIGIGRSVALIETSNGERITLLNPKVINESGETDEQYEGCLSFFDVRGIVSRSLTIEVEHQDINGNVFITEFSDGAARLVCHEIDHLDGRLYRDRMRPGSKPIPVSQYRGTGQTWQYQQP